MNILVDFIVEFVQAYKKTISKVVEKMMVLVREDEIDTIRKLLDFNNDVLIDFGKKIENIESHSKNILFFYDLSNKKIVKI